MRGRFPPAVDETVLPRSLVERFAGCPVEGGALVLHRPERALDLAA